MTKTLIDNSEKEELSSKFKTEFQRLKQMKKEKSKLYFICYY